VCEISTWQTILNELDFSTILSLLLSVIPSLICITLHELSHGFVAYKLGDTTAKDSGRLTLNPIKHLDLMGLVMMIAFHVGWAKPVPVNMNRFDNPKRGMALTALAGPMSNFLIAVVFLFLYGALYIPLRETQAGSYVLQMIGLTAQISIGYGVFNMIPFPPLDGSKVLFSLMSDEGYYKLMRYERFGMILLFVLVMTGVFGDYISAAIEAAYDFLFPIAQFGLDTAVLFLK